ncbi:hypothetical protein ACJMK2_039371 [Sinanodonta woodiana]|uniref:C-type lectin domain-containing protein n=1 Tax=Sinanodonta woodiana TaxID=1069815 RepID=A0ABD3WCV8_SINWO
MRYRLSSTKCGRFCYLIENRNCLKYEDARAACAVDGGDLLNVDTCYHDFFVALATRSQGGCDPDFWIGARRMQLGADFITVTGDIISTQSVLWASGKPNNDNDKNCVELERNKKYRLGNENCDHANGYICQIFI